MSTEDPNDGMDDNQRIYNALAYNDSNKRRNESKGGCFIATAAFENEECEELVILRRFRDERLLTNKAGRKFVESYYAYGPGVAERIKNKPLAKRMVRGTLRVTCKVLK